MKYPAIVLLAVLLLLIGFTGTAEARWQNVDSVTLSLGQGSNSSTFLTLGGSLDSQGKIVPGTVGTGNLAGCLTPGALYKMPDIEEGYCFAATSNGNPAQSDVVRVNYGGCQYWTISIAGASNWSGAYHLWANVLPPI